jgi:cell division septation protein DedD
MSEKTKLIVFAKKEIFLLLVFFFLAVGISFTIGVKMGSNYSYSLTHDPQDRSKVNQTAQMLSTEEESVEKQQAEMEQAQAQGQDIPEAQQQNDITTDTNKMMEKHLQEKLREQGTPDSADASDNEVEKVNKEQLAGKYTIQVGSFASFPEAEEFAQGFKMRGYSPIIEKGEVPNKGIRFSVSLGSFDNQNDAREYIAKERSLFISQDYYIREIR